MAWLRPYLSDRKGGAKRAKKYDIETEVIDSTGPIPVVDYKSEAFELVEKTINEVYPTAIVSPYIMTGGTDAKFYSELTANGLRFAPLYATADQISRVHGIDENLSVDTLALGVDFYKKLIQGLQKGYNYYDYKMKRLYIEK